MTTIFPLCSDECVSAGRRSRWPPVIKSVDICRRHLTGPDGRGGAAVAGGCEWKRRKSTREDLRPVDHRRIVGHGSVLNIFIQKEWDQLPTSLIMRRACRRVPSGDRNRSHCFSVFNVMRHLPLFFFQSRSRQWTRFADDFVSGKKIGNSCVSARTWKMATNFRSHFIFPRLARQWRCGRKVGWNGRGTAKLR